MPDIEVLSSDPGREVRVGQGARILVIRDIQRSPSLSAGLAVMGVIGSPTDDQGVPNVPVLLSSVQDIFSKWGGFKAHVGDGDAAGYNGNVAAMLWRLPCKRVVFQPVDMAFKDKTITDVTAVDLKAKIARGALSFTVEESDDIFTCAGHPFVAGDTFQVVQLLAGTGVASFTTYHVIAPVVAGTSFKASASAGGASLAVTVDGSGTLVPLSVATPDYAALSLKAGTRLVRKARTFNITHATSDETFTTDEPHGLIVGETVTIANLTGGSGGTAGDYVVATAPTTTTLTLTGFTTTTDITAGTLARLTGSFIVRTLEDVEWAVDEYAAIEVRVAPVSGTVCAINKVDGFHTDDAPPTAAALAISTTDTTVPDAIDAAEILARYEAAIDAFNVNEDGKSATILVTDRTESGINDALATHCSEASGQGILRICVTAPPVGTSVADAKLASGDGVDRTTLETEYAIYVHPGFRRRFDLDQANLSSADDYKATFPGQALLAARMCNVRPEENPTYVDSEPFTTYGVAEVELELSAAEKAAHFQAGICTAVTERYRGRWVGAYRDGVMADGTQIARKRLTDYLTAGAIERATPWHKRLATTDNRQGLFDSVESWLESLKTPAGAEQQRISDYTLTLTWDGEVEEATLLMEIEEVGNMNVLTIRLSVGASGFSVLGGEEA